MKNAKLCPLHILQNFSKRHHFLALYRARNVCDFAKQTLNGCNSSLLVLTVFLSRLPLIVVHLSRQFSSQPVSRSSSREELSTKTRTLRWSRLW